MLEKAVIAIWMAAGMPTRKIFFSMSQLSFSFLGSSLIHSLVLSSVTRINTAELACAMMVASATP